MERADLLEANGGIFKPQGEAIAAGAADDIKVLVVGNPANTNALIAQRNADGVPAERFTAMTRLDHNRAVAQLAQKTGAAVSRDHQHGDLGQPLADDVPRPVQREGARASARGTRSATRPGWRTSTSRASASAARRSSRRAARPRPPRPPTPPIDHVHDWVNGTADGDWVSMAVPSDGSYGVRRGDHLLVPGAGRRGGECEIVQGLDVPDVLPASGSTRRSRSSQEERDGRREARPDLAQRSCRRVASVAPRAGASRGRT